MTPARRLLTLPLVALLALLVGPTVALAQTPSGPDAAPSTPIEHVVVLMQSNHSFDNYFGTYPGADGIPPGTCLPRNRLNPNPADCVAPFELGATSPDDLDHTPGTQRAQVNGGRMDGFVSAYRALGLDGTDAMGHYDRSDLPFSWATADQFTLFDHFFSSATSGSHLNHFYWVTGGPTPGGREQVPPGGYGNILTIFDRLTAAQVSWKFYVEHYDPAVTYRSPDSGTHAGQSSKVPLLDFARFLDDPALAARIVDLSQYDRDLRDGTLPAVAYMVTSASSENPPSRIQAGQSLVRGMLTELAQSRYWRSSAFLWTYDGWGGWYDHVAPPAVDRFGYGLRVPALLVSPYARRGFVDHTVLDYTAVLRFVEDNWRLAPLAERDARSPGLASAFDFTHPPPPAELIASQQASAAPESRRAAVVYASYGAAALFVAAIGLGGALSRRARRRRRSRPTGVLR